ncbi:Uncharacterised protein [Mycobacteroides abscessus]|nr:Uncharacterised protein [Mycobacteroides abscessus]
MPNFVALAAMEARRDGSISKAEALQPVPLRDHSTAILPDPAPTSQSRWPGRGPSAARVTARISCLVI